MLKSRLFIPSALLIFVFQIPSFSQAVWQVTRFDVNADATGGDRTLKARATLALKNVGQNPGSTLTLAINPKAEIVSATVGGGNLAVRTRLDPRGNLQRFTLSLPSAVAPGAAITSTVDYRIPIESNTGLASLSPVQSIFLPLSWWYPQPNTPFSVRGADQAPVHLTVNIPGGMQLLSSGSVTGNTAELSLNGQPFFVTGYWDRVEGTGDAAGITAFLPQGAGPDEIDQAKKLITLAQAARSYFAGSFGNAPTVPLRLVATSRGSGFNQAGTLLLDPSAFRRPQIDATTAMNIAESIAHVWLGGMTPIRGEGLGAVSEGLVRFLATQFIEERFGRDAAAAERARERKAYSAVAKRDAPLAITTPLDDTYFTTVSNKGALVWRLLDRTTGHDNFIRLLKAQISNGSSNPEEGLTLSGLRTSMAQASPDVKALSDAFFDRPTDLDLLVGLPQQKGAQWTIALRNTGIVNVKSSVAATLASGQVITQDVSIPAQGFGEATINNSARIARIEVDPEKIIPQIDYANDVMPKAESPDEVLASASAAFARQQFPQAETALRNVLAASPNAQEVRALLGRTYLAENKLDDAEREFNTNLKDPLPSATAMAWSYTGLAEVASKRGQFNDAARRFQLAAKIDAEYGATLAARLDRIKAETQAGSLPKADPFAESVISRFDEAVKNGRKASLESVIVPGELSTFQKGIIGTQPETWVTRIARTEALDSNTLAVDVQITARELGQDQSGTALLILKRVNGAWLLNNIEFFEVR